MKKKSLLVVLSSIIVLIILCIFFINRTNSYNYIYKNVSLEEDTSIGTNLYVVSKNDKIDTKSKNYKKVIDDKISDVLKQEIDFENMIIIYDPYDTNKNSVKLYFITNYDVIVNYKLTVNDNLSDFSNIGNNYTTQHEYEIKDIVLGEVNVLTFELRDKEDNLIGTNKVTLNFSNVK